MAVELRRRDEQGIMKAMARVTNCEARQDPASANGDRSVDRVDAIGEARSDLVQPFALRVGALGLRLWQLVDAPDDLGQRRCRDIERGVVGLRTIEAKAWPSASRAS
jgi:hypothetical protein